MKILQINKLYYPWVGGVETVVQQFAEETVKKGFDVTVLCCNTAFKTVRETISQVKVIRASSLGIYFSMPVSISFFKILRQETADILHFHLPNPLAVIAYFLVRPQGKVVVTWHSDIVKQRFFLFFFHPFLIWFLKRTSIILSTSPVLIQHSFYLRRFAHKTISVPLGIRPELYVMTSDIGEKVLAIQKTHPHFVLFVGRLVYYKGIQPLLDAVRDTDTHLVMIGDGPLKPMVLEYQKRFLGDRLTLLDPVDFVDLVAWFYACDFLVLPSVQRSEAFGIVQLEAMICAKPVISTHLPTGVSYVNQHMSTGILVTPGDSEVLRKAILALSDDGLLCQKMGEQARKRVMRLFTLDRMISDVVAVYEGYCPIV